VFSLRGRDHLYEVWTFAVRPDIKSNIQAEIVRKVKEEVDLQFKDHVPISLEQQLEETEKQLQEVKISFKNS